MKIRLAGIAYDSLVNGPGMRRVFFSQGCTHGCKECFNPDTHAFTGGIEFEINDIVNEVNKDPLLQGITFSGGDPFQQAEAFTELACRLANYNIWAYTGYVFEELIDNPLLQHIDVVVDGAFDITKVSPTLLYRGSSNQRIIDVKASLKTKTIVEVKL